MNDIDIRRALMQFIEQRNALVAQRDELSIKIINTEQNIKNLQAALTETLFAANHELEYGTVGLTEAVRAIFRRAGKPLSSAEIKTSLKVIGFDIYRFSNPTAAVANTLQRMAKSGELVFNTANETYRLMDAFEAFKIAHDRKMAREEQKLRPQERFKLEHTKGKR